MIYWIDDSAEKRGSRSNAYFSSTIQNRNPICERTDHRLVRVRLGQKERHCGYRVLLGPTLPHTPPTCTVQSVYPLCPSLTIGIVRQLFFSAQITLDGCGTGKFQAGVIEPQSAFDIMARMT